MVIVSLLLVSPTRVQLFISGGIYNSLEPTEMNTVHGFVKRKKMSAVGPKTSHVFAHNLHYVSMRADPNLGKRLFIFYLNDV